MSSSARILALPKAQGAREARLFHMVSRVIPADQIVRAVPPDTPARDALKIMQQGGYSQLPVVQGRSVLGIFSHRAFALEALQSDGTKQSLGSLPVEEFLGHEKPAFASLTDEFRELIDVLDRQDCVVVSGPENLVAIITAMDVLRYLYSVANSFVLMEEIELALRALLRRSFGEGQLFVECVRNALTSKYKETLPHTLEEMTFDDYVSLVRDGRNWQYCEHVLGGTRERARVKLEGIGSLRNDLFHFKRDLSVEDHQQLTACRDWLLRCTRKVTARASESAE